MLLAEAGCVFTGFILCISVVQGQENSICALRGSSVDLLCSAERPTSSMKWYTVHLDGSKYVQSEISADGNRVTYNVSEQRNFTLTINDLRESDAQFYCCRETDKPVRCWLMRTELRVADLQVKVIPTTEEQRVTLMCNTSCPLTENPAAYIWYKNRELLYEDWSPWYQHLVSSDEADRYSCAIKGYEDLRAPEVSVDSVTPTCFTVTYAKGRMCSYQQKSVDESCPLTYPKEVYVQRTRGRSHITLTCNTSCPLTDPHTAYRWYKNKHVYRYSDGQELLVSGTTAESFSCAVKGLEDVRSAEVCTENTTCWSVSYISRRICALEGSSVNITSEYSCPDNQQPQSTLWYMTKKTGTEEAEKLVEDAGRVEYHKNQNHHSLSIKNLKRDDSAGYTFRLRTDEGWKQSHFTAATLIVTGLRVTMTPSAVVTEGQRVTLTCSTSCPLTDDTNYTWYLNSRPLTLPENQNKCLVLDPVISQHAGNYSCAVKTHNIRSSEETLTVQSEQGFSVLATGKSMEMTNAVRLTVVLLITSLLYLWMRKKKTLTCHAEPNTVQTGQYVNMSHKFMNPVTAAQREPAERQEDTV